MKKYQKGSVGIIVAIVVAILVIGGGAYYINNKDVESPIQADHSDWKTVDWKTYAQREDGGKQETGHYQISYPTDATVAPIDKSANPSNCFEVIQGSGYILIGHGANSPCTSTGVGVYDKKVEDAVNINGVTYKASGFVSPGNVSSFTSFGLADNTSITYGVKTDGKSITSITDEDYAKIITSLKSIISTFKSVQ